MKLSTSYSNNYHSTKTMLFDYSGVIDQNLLRTVVNFHEDIFGKINACNSFKRKVITSIIETLQNVTKYGLKNSKGLPEGKFASCYDDSDFIFECSNEISGGQLKSIKKQLKELSSVPIDTLKGQYITRMNEDWIDPEKGAELGLLYLFINSEKNISFSFQNKKENNYLFSLKISLKR